MQKIWIQQIKKHLKATTDVKFIDKSKNLTIKANEISYFKNEEIILAKGKVIIEDQIKNITIRADKIKIFKKEDKIIADGKVDYLDTTNNIKISTDKISYFRNLEKIFTKGSTVANIQSKYKFDSKNVNFNNKDKELSSKEKTIIQDRNFTLYELDNFSYDLNREFLKGKNIKIIENYKSPPGKTNKYFFADGFFDLKNKNFKNSETKISLKKNIFDRSENDPRLYGSSP